MTIKTSEAVGAVLDYLVAKAEGRALREPRRGTDTEAAQRTVPFTMYEAVARTAGDRSDYHVETITVTRFGVRAGCSAPSIDFADSAKRRGLGSVDLFYFDRAEAELDCLGSANGWADDFCPSTDWAQGGPIIEREGIQLSGWESRWEAKLYWSKAAQGGPKRYWNMTGPNPLIAAMRCYVASKLGSEVEVPEELLESV